MMTRLLKKTITLMLFGIVTSLPLSNCSDSITTPAPGSGTPSDTSASVFFFPNSRDIVWVYELFDSLAAVSIDTVTITIRGERTLQSTGNFVRVWETFHSATDLTDTSFVRVSGDSVQFYGSDLTATGHDLILLPLAKNKRWENPGLFATDSGGTLAIDSVSVPAGDFSRAARVLNGWEVDFMTDGNLTTSWVVDSLGIVQRQELKRFVLFSDTTVEENIIWSLLGSNLIQNP